MKQAKVVKEINLHGDTTSALPMHLYTTASKESGRRTTHAKAAHTLTRILGIQ